MASERDGRGSEGLDWRRRRQGTRTDGEPERPNPGDRTLGEERRGEPRRIGDEKDELRSATVPSMSGSARSGGVDEAVKLFAELMMI